MKESSTGLSRREMMSLLGAGVAYSALAGCSTPAAATMATTTQLADPLTYSSTGALADAIRTKRVSSEEVVRTHLARIEEVNPKLNAVVQLVADRALEEAREADAALAKGELKGPLHGVPMTIKDSFSIPRVLSRLAGRRGVPSSSRRRMLPSWPDFARRGRSYSARPIQPN